MFLLTSEESLSVSYHTGSIFDSKAPMICNPVNCVGISGAGLAKAFADKYTKHTAIYKKLCEDKKFKLGDVIEIYHPKENKVRILYVATKNDWRDKTPMGVLGIIFTNIDKILEELNISHIAMPLFGAGLGGLSPSIVAQMIDIWYKDKPINVEVWNLE